MRIVIEAMSEQGPGSLVFSLEASGVVLMQCQGESWVLSLADISATAAALECAAGVRVADER